MATIGKTVVREPATGTPAAYSSRVYALAAIYTALFLSSTAGLAIIVWRAQYLVTLSQRSNVETLALAFFMIFFAYFALISRAGAVGAMRLVIHTVTSLFQSNKDAAERHKMRALKPANGLRLEVALSSIVEQKDRPGQPFDVPVADAAGSMGHLRFDGARVTFFPAYQRASNEIFAYVEQQLGKLLQQQGVSREVEIVRWKTIDDENTATHLGLVDFARNLERYLDTDELWPKVRLTVENIAELERRLSAICPALRNESFLPDWEYTAEHKLPIIPEPLGMASLSRVERRADPLTTMGLALLIILGTIGILVLIIAFPPWVPGS